ncbi:hypothetical protein Tco_1220321 [Tanacetum coccineum]
MKNEEDEIGSLKTRLDNGEKGEVSEALFGCVRSRGMGCTCNNDKTPNESGKGEGFLEKFGGGFELDIDEQDKKKNRSREDDEETKICYGLNNRGDEERWKSMTLSKKVQEMVCLNREMLA